jgi:hypothetical protein
MTAPSFASQPRLDDGGEADGRSSAEADIERRQTPERTDAHDPERALLAASS